MADIPLSNILGVSSSLRPFSLSNGGTIATGTTADFVISCPPNKHIRIGNLYAVGGSQGGVTLNCGGRNLFTGNLGEGGSALIPTPTLVIGNAGGSNGSGYTQPTVAGGRGEDFTISFGSATTRDIRYRYDILEDDE